MVELLLVLVGGVLSIAGGMIAEFFKGARATQEEIARLMRAIERARRDLGQMNAALEAVGPPPSGTDEVMVASLLELAPPYLDLSNVRCP